jgi:hypothetical protein
MKTNFHSVYIRKDFESSEIISPIGPFLKRSNIGSSNSLTIECNHIDLTHFKYAELSARFGETEKYLKLRIPHDIIFMILSAEERLSLDFGFVPASESD